VLSAAKGVADGSADPKHVIGVKTAVVHDVVEVSFGAHEEMSPHGVADAAAKMKQELIAIKVGGAT
jgi:hypothetical protein